MPANDASGALNEAPQDAQHDGAHNATGAAPIDPYVLADKVYALLLADARLSHARADRGVTPRRSAEE
jgi:hypothetical protein